MCRGDSGNYHQRGKSNRAFPFRQASILTEKLTDGYSFYLPYWSEYATLRLFAKPNGLP
jgi:hypothetical protein